MLPSCYDCTHLLHPTDWTALPRRLVDAASRALAERRRRTLANRDLQALDAYMLRDIGVSHRAVAATQAVDWPRAPGNVTRDGGCRAHRS